MMEPDSLDDIIDVYVAGTIAEVVKSEAGETVQLSEVRSCAQRH
jgi:hypothetical protein